MSYSDREITKMMRSAMSRQDVLDILDGCGIDVNAPSLEGFLSQIRLSDNAIETLIERKADINRQGFMDSTALHRYAQLTTVKNRTDDKNRDPRVADILQNQSNLEGYDHTIRRIKMLIDHNANVNIADGMGFTPLYHIDTLEGIKLLIDAKANVLHRDRKGRTPFKYYNQYNKYARDEDEYNEICKLYKDTEKKQKKEPVDKVLVKQSEKQYNGGDQCCDIM